MSIDAPLPLSLPPARSLTRLAGLWLLLPLLLLACRSRLPLPQSPAGSPPLSHAAWDSLLARYVDSAGWVRYGAWQADSQGLVRYLDRLAAQPPAAEASEGEQIAYWLNAYNAYTVLLILRHYPLGSITELHRVRWVATVWDQKWFSIGGMAMSLGQIEHQILRAYFAEPRIHFALNCASYSCPSLRGEAYTADRLDAQLDAQARDFLADPRRNRITPEGAEISRLFLWFRGDFTRMGSLRDFLDHYAPQPIGPSTPIRYLDYDWSLNVAPAAGPP